jgi:hypothetical protein
MASVPSGASRRTSQMDDGLSGLPNNAYNNHSNSNSTRGTRFTARSAAHSTLQHSNGTSITGLPRTEVRMGYYHNASDSDGTNPGNGNGDEGDMEEVLEDLLNPVSKQLDFASRLGQELVAQRSTLEELQSRWQGAKERGEVDTARDVEREIKMKREEYAGTTISRLKQIAESVSSRTVLSGGT